MSSSKQINKSNKLFDTTSTAKPVSQRDPNDADMMRNLVRQHLDGIFLSPSDRKLLKEMDKKTYSKYAAEWAEELKKKLAASRGSSSGPSSGYFQLPEHDQDYTSSKPLLSKSNLTLVNVDAWNRQQARDALREGSDAAAMQELVHGGIGKSQTTGHAMGRFLGRKVGGRRRKSRRKKKKRRRKKTRKKRGGSTVIIDGKFIKKGDLVEVLVSRGTGTVKFKGIFIKEGLGTGGQPTFYFHSTYGQGLPTYTWDQSKKWVSIRLWNVPIDEIDSINVISNEKGRTGAGGGKKRRRRTHRKKRKTHRRRHR